MHRLCKAARAIPALALIGITALFGFPAGAAASRTNSEQFPTLPELVVNKSVVAFGGNTWWVIGNAESGIWPQPNSVTLLQKEITDDDQNLPFRMGQGDDPGDGSLVSHWIHDQDGSPSYTSVGTPDGTVNVPTINWYVANPSGMAEWKTPNEYLGSTLQQHLAASASQLSNSEQAVINPRTFTGGDGDNTPSADEINGPTAENQLLWALSGQEMIQIGNTAVRSYGADWWLRGIARSAQPAPYTTSSSSGWGVGSSGGNWVIDNCYANLSARAALSLDLSNALFASSASAEGKSAATIGSGLTTMSTPTADADHPVKFTITNDALSLDIAATRAQSTQSASTLSFSYADASIGSGMYLSGILTNSEGAVAYYGKLADLSSAESGTVSIPLANVASGTYTLSLFAEQTNGDLYTDFCSAPITMTVTVAEGVGTVSDFGGTVLHEHAWSDEWASDGIHHWHECTESDCPITDNAEKAGYGEHTPADKWSSNGEQHWHDCTVCGVSVDIADHSFTWVVDREPTTNAAGAKHEECSVCGYAKGSVPIPAIGDSSATPPATGDTETGKLAATGDVSMLSVAAASLLGFGMVVAGTILRHRRQR